MEIVLLGEAYEADYEHFLHAIPTSWIYSSLKYRDFLKQIVGPQSIAYWLLLDEGEIQAALPTMTSQAGPYGSIFNSLPFFGSNGGLLVQNPHDYPRQWKEALFEELQAYITRHSIASATLAPHPFQDQDFRFRLPNHSFTDPRLSQITPLPASEPTRESRLDSILGLVHQKTRNCIRKCWKSKVQISHSSSPRHLQGLFKIHRECMQAIQGRWKPWSVFQAIADTFDYDQDYRLYIAEQDGELIAALLVLFYHQTAEYFIPASKAEHRTDQPMSGLVAEAMQDAMARGLTWWNWGGTWLSQKGVYHFKKRWGTLERPYRYTTAIFDDRILSASKEPLLQAYPYFYIAPFDQIDSGPS